jgi:hypothetical protein
MRIRRPSVAAVQIALDAERHVALGDLRNGILTLLGIWIAYFLGINFFIQRLDRIIVPVVELPLGQVLVAQGFFVIFVCALYLLIRHRHSG